MQIDEYTKPFHHRICYLIIPLDAGNLHTNNNNADQWTHKALSPCSPSINNATGGSQPSHKQTVQINECMKLFHHIINPSTISLDARNFLTRQPQCRSIIHEALSSCHLLINYATECLQASRRQQHKWWSTHQHFQFHHIFSLDLVQSPDRLGCRGDMRDDSAAILF